MKWLDKFLLHPKLAVLLAALAVLLAAPALWSGLLADDYWHRAAFLQPTPFEDLFASPITGMYTFGDGDPERTRSLMDMGLWPWWTLEEGRLSLMRPLSALTHWLDFAAWPNFVGLMHLQSLAWFALAVFAVAMMYRRIMGPTPAAGLAALLFAVDDAHALPAAWLTNRNALLSILFGALTIALHDRWRRDRGANIDSSAVEPAESKAWVRPRVAAVLAPLCLGVGLLSNEGAVAVTAYLFSYAVFLDRGSWKARVVTLLPYAAIVLAWRAFYQMGDYGAWGSARYIDPLVSPVAFLQSVAVRAPVLLLGQWGLPPADAFRLAGPELRVFVWIVAVVFLLGLGLVLYPLLRRNAMARFWCVGMLIALLPSCATAPMDRLMMNAGLGAMGLLGLFLVDLREGIETERPGGWRALRGTFAAGLIVVHLAIAPVLLPVRIAYFDALGDTFDEIIASAPLDDEAVSGQTVVLVNAPSYPFAMYLPIVRALNGQPPARNWRSLAPADMTPMRVTRVDERSLRVRPEGGFRWSLYRDDRHPMSVGEVVSLSGLRVEVLSIHEHGYPLEALFRFDVSLEDPSLVWLELRGKTLHAFTPPALGESIDLND